MIINRKLKWIILSDPMKPPYKGGPLILHYISKKLLDIGDEVIMNFPHFDGISKLTDEDLHKLDKNEFIVIKSENDFRLDDFKNIVRIILYIPKTDHLYHINELIIQYGLSFTKNTIFSKSYSFLPFCFGLRLLEKHELYKKSR